MVAFLRADGSTGKCEAGVIKTSLGSFRGWYCASGYTLLTINSRGAIYGNVCKSGKTYGNIYEGDFELPRSFIICDKAACHCSSDLKIPKGKTLEDIKAILAIKDRYIQPSKDLTDVVAIRRYSTGPRVFCVDWSIGTRCNYDCSYCSPAQHSKTKPHLSLERWCTAWDLLYSKINTQPDILLTILGGEPTINPNYLQMLSYASKPNVKIVTTTNGTAHVDKLKHIMSYGGLCISIHLEYCNIPKMIHKIHELAYHINDYNFLNISFMMPPGRSQDYLDFRASIPTVKRLGIEAVPIFENSTKMLLHYEQHEIDIINNY